MIGIAKIYQNLRQTFFRTLRSLPVCLIARGLVHLPEHPRPEPVRPEMNPSRHVQVMVFPVTSAVRNHGSYASALCFHLDYQLVVGLFKPGLILQRKRRLVDVAHTHTCSSSFHSFEIAVF